MRLRPSHQIVLVYVAIGALWIGLSDAAVRALFGETPRLTWARSIEGIGYVLITALLLLIMIGRRVRRLERAHAAVVESYEQTIRAWVHVLDLHHHEAKDHTLRVSRMTVAMARLLRVGDDELVQIERGALLHDIGKVGVPDAILTKRGPLDAEERRIIERHPTIAFELLREIDFLAPCLDIPYCHHEKWDGRGYPRGLRGMEIPFAARVFAIVDVWDALSFDRVYKSAWPQAAVVAFLEREAGRHFDPDLVPVFLAHREALIRAGIASGTVQVLEAPAIAISDVAAPLPERASGPSALIRSSSAAP
ncbi:MAG: HD domain-containing protein [Planctomycetes bacterium]|nr:HD domain-containing protein [Planctomycetota bacterium]